MVAHLARTWCQTPSCTQHSSYQSRVRIVGPVSSPAFTRGPSTWKAVKRCKDCSANPWRAGGQAWYGAGVPQEVTSSWWWGLWQNHFLSLNAWSAWGRLEALIKSRVFSWLGMMWGYSHLCPSLLTNAVLVQTCNYKLLGWDLENGGHKELPRADALVCWSHEHAGSLPEGAPRLGTQCGSPWGPVAFSQPSTAWSRPEGCAVGRARWHLWFVTLYTL